MLGLLRKGKTAIGCAGFALLAVVGFTLIAGGINSIFNLLFWIPSKFFGVFLSAAVLALIVALLVLTVGRVTRLEGIQQSIVVSAQTVLLVVAFSFFVLLTESTVSRQTAQWALYTVIGVPFVGLFGAILDGRWLALVSLTAMGLGVWLTVAGSASLESREHSQRPIAIARIVVLVTVVLVGAGLYFRGVDSLSPSTVPALESKQRANVPDGFFQGSQSSVEIDVQQIGHRLKLSFLGPMHSESIVSTRRLYERMHAHGFYSRSLPYIDAAIQMSEQKYGSLSPETLRHMVARLKVQLLKGEYEESDKLVKRILLDLETGGDALAEVRCGFKIELAGAFSSAGHQFDVSRLMEGVLTDPKCQIAQDLTYRLPAYIAYARGLIAEERYQEAMAVFMVAAAEAADVISERSALGVQLLQAFADLSIRVGDPIETLVLEERIWELVDELSQEGHPLRVNSDARLARALANAGFYSEALASLESALPALEQTFGASSPILIGARLVQVQALRNLDATKESVALAQEILADAVTYFGDLDQLTSQAKKELIASFYAADMLVMLAAEGTRMLAHWPAAELNGESSLRFRDQAIEIAKYVAISRTWSEDLHTGFALAEAVKSETARFRGKAQSDRNSRVSLELASVEEQIASAYAFPELRVHLESRRRQLIQTMAGESPTTDPPTFAEGDAELLPSIFRALAENEAYASYLLTADGLGILFMVRGEVLEAYGIDIPYYEIEAFHEFLMSPDGQQGGTPYDGSALTKAVFPFWDDSASGEFPEKLVVSPDLWLRHLPFDALQLQNQPLITKSAISITSHSSGWLKARAAGGKASSLARLLVVGNPSYGSGAEAVGSVMNADEPMLAAAYRSALSAAASGGGGWTMLPGSEKEIEGLKAIWDADQIEVISGADAHETLVVEALDTAEKRFDYVLFSTHGFSNPIEPEVSALVLAPRPNGAEAMSQLSAAKIRRLNLGADLVFLSACDTNSRPISSLLGPVGLPRAFSEAGAAYIVTTLWPILDDVAPEISNRFFEAVLKGEHYADALANAKRQVSTMQGSEHPYFWAGFMLYEGG